MQDVAGITLPDSKLCTATMDYARRVSDPFLFNHVMRSYVFAEIAGQAQTARYDREVLFVSAVLHDLGLTDVVPYRERFEVEGADAAKAFLSGLGMTDRDLDTVWDAIALHTSVGIAQRKGAEIAICQLGIAVDVGVVPLDLISGPLVAAVLEAYPRLGFKQAIVAALSGVHDRNPAAARQSAAVVDVCAHHVAGFRRPDLCTAIEVSAFAE